MSRSDKPWQWKPGTSGNPGGRPKEDPEMKAILKAACPRAAAKLVELLDCVNPKIVLSAANSILDRIYGRPKESVDMNVSQDDNINLQIRGVLLEELKKKKKKQQNNNDDDGEREYGYAEADNDDDDGNDDGNGECYEDYCERERERSAITISFD